ncbi:MAG: hypothetical protein PHD21_00640 [Flavobacteriales bacterium]|nr:hypothetical protein [Flavobacteriales bacterium]
MKLRLFLMLLCGVLAMTAQGKKLPKSVLKDSLPVMTARCEKLLKAAYMEGTLIGETDTLPGWEGYPVKLYEYYTGKDVRVGAPKKGKVYLLDPSPEKLAMWILTTSWEVKGNIDRENTDKIYKRILGQSGAQFPVSGVVYEAMYKAGEYYPYLFKDGVTVYLKDSTDFAKDQHPTEEMLDFYLHMKYSDLTERTGTYARIISTTREMYTAAGGKVDVGTSEDKKQIWLCVVRDLYKKAWKNDRNELMIAWAKGYL